MVVQVLRLSRAVQEELQTLCGDQDEHESFDIDWEGGR